MARGKASAERVCVSGVYAALATPRHSDRTEVNTSALLEYLDAVSSAQVDGLVLFGSTGEFIHFDLADRMRAVTFAIRRSRIPVLVNVSHSTLAGAIALAEDAVTAGAAGVLLLPPYFYRYDDGQILHFFERFTRALHQQIPVYLYNLPSSTNPISPALAQRLLCSGELAGIKDSSGSWDFLESLLALRAQHPFALLAGSEELYLRARAGGVDGSISGISAALPELMVALDRAILASQTERAQRLDHRLQELIHWIRQFPPTIAIKQIAVARRWKQDHFAFPLDSATVAALSRFHQWLSKWLPLTLSECADKA